MMKRNLLVVTALAVLPLSGLDLADPLSHLLVPRGAGNLTLITTWKLKYQVSLTSA